jgi:hypothetical protein
MLVKSTLVWSNLKTSGDLKIVKLMNNFIAHVISLSLIVQPLGIVIILKNMPSILSNPMTLTEISILT